MENNKTIRTAVDALEDLKGQDVTVIDVRGKTDVFDAMIIVTGTSDRHVKSMADRVVMDAKKNDLDVLGVEADRAWVLVDLYDVIVHIMLEEVRSFYSLEKLWNISAVRENIE